MNFFNQEFVKIIQKAKKKPENAGKKPSQVKVLNINEARRLMRRVAWLHAQLLKSRGEVDEMAKSLYSAGTELREIYAKAISAKGDHIAALERELRLSPGEKSAAETKKKTEADVSFVDAPDSKIWAALKAKQ